ncbi:EAL domain-containing protein [Sporosalibacterium faouarense]|uniref:EAL domain-containing protein n=1 Tax=Sporosalibacterium faouarense TaxID=516123 RepID=UPI00141CDA72|nr:EAL domain-containing protein [Sporosalibacterium faouarense]MTI49842.1 EAL domain-containing protein [Bacillota bacterium]
MEGALKHNLYYEFKDIIDNRKIKTLYQPIVGLKSGDILGYEALSRGPQNSYYFSPLNLFKSAREYDMLWDLELVCRQKALENSQARVGDKKLFINIDPNTIQDKKFKQGFTKLLLQDFNINPYDIIFEINENTAISDYRKLRDALDNYSEQGYQIALDDAGSGYSGLVLLAETHPNFIKIDMSLVRDIDKNKFKQDLMRTFCEFSKNTSIKVIAEGIETENELKTLIELGVEYGQGYLLQEPKEEIFKSIDFRKLELISDLNFKGTTLKEGNLNDYCIGNMSRKDTPIVKTSTIKDVNEIFVNHHTLQGLVVVEDDKPIGLIMRNKFYFRLLKDGFKGTEEKYIEDIMLKLPLTVDYRASIKKVVELAMSRREERTYDYVIVSKDNEYHGIVPILTILESLKNVNK